MGVHKYKNLKYVRRRVYDMFVNCYLLKEQLSTLVLNVSISCCQESADCVHCDADLGDREVSWAGGYSA